ncbi:hypothetical protein POTOM_005336 [Populus tomentosa]|uniref:Uncharacterized protein n=1 Tax=Populus tomentosa TaxID=118781 RepID=A0A8X8D6H4_POPTO|nr:hypothetical protein POTOM_005336 [Populus tomentosa]
MEEVPDPRLGLTLSSDLIQDPILCSSPFLRRSKKTAILLKIVSERAAVVGDAVYYIKQLVRTVDELKQLVGRTKMKKCGVVAVNTKPTVLGSRYNHSYAINGGSSADALTITDKVTEVPDSRCS